MEEFPDDIFLPTLTDSQKHHLAAPFQAQDVLKTFKSMAKNKCPGPNGFSVEFFLETWHIVGEDVTRGILPFFKHLHMPRIINYAALALIPKHNSASEIVDYRPISCCNVIIGVFQKCLPCE